MNINYSVYKLTFSKPFLSLIQIIQFQKIYERSNNTFGIIKNRTVIKKRLSFKKKTNSQFGIFYLFADKLERLSLNSLQKLEKHKWSSVDSLLDEEKREAIDKFNSTGILKACFESLKQTFYSHNFPSINST